MLSCLIVDDEQSALDVLRDYIQRTPFLTLAASTTNPLEALGLLQTQPLDLLLLDIHMPQLSGLDVLRLVQGPTRVILTTAYSQFAVEAFELNALDYLLKPIAYERFLAAAQKALPSSSAPAAQGPLADQADNYLFVQTDGKGKMRRVNYADILYVEGLKNYVAIHTREARIVTLLNLKDLEERLPAAHFRRVHKSYLVALDKIRALDGQQILLQHSTATVPLGDTYRPAFFAALQDKIMGKPK